jgi:hypothetical protein
MNDAFLSIVDKECGPDELLVRARRPGDIERVFPRAKVISRIGTDYQFRAVVPRTEVGEAMMVAVMTVDYDNFKNSVRDRKLHDAYASFWHQHARLQPSPPYSRHNGSLI